MVKQYEHQPRYPSLSLFYQIFDVKWGLLNERAVAPFELVFVHVLGECPPRILRDATFTATAIE